MRIERDDRRGADHAGDLDGVHAQPADPPQPDRLPVSQPGALGQARERRRHGVGQDRRLLERHVVGHLDQAYHGTTTYSAHAPS